VRDLELRPPREELGTRAATRRRLSSDRGVGRVRSGRGPILSELWPNTMREVARGGDGGGYSGGEGHGRQRMAREAGSGGGGREERPQLSSRGSLQHPKEKGGRGGIWVPP
jgi:hypothetical protein